MPHKLEFSVCRFTSEDAEGRAQDLQLQGPGARGWRSAKFSIYPQELVLQFSERVHLTRVQLLSHHALVPERVQLLIGDTPPEGEMGVLGEAQFTPLGYVGLSDNSHTEHKARELKSVNVDCTGTFLKLLVYKNYVNKLNKYNQVVLRPSLPAAGCAAAYPLQQAVSPPCAAIAQSCSCSSRPRVCVHTKNHV
ncbi:centrosomal protein of 104 kDa-like [Hyalella azteca]|uniref:Centrosomal protein of 104 kDa-like n=1 Tax=Hyalella azteca TaxID=294128 RepID=A0A979FK61_HYAAZ|nr:centrosomal protein of 104 kDa-like [Hyalella azteca]